MNYDRDSDSSSLVSSNIAVLIYFNKLPFDETIWDPDIAIGRSVANYPSISTCQKLDHGTILLLSWPSPPFQTSMFVQCLQGRLLGQLHQILSVLLVHSYAIVASSGLT